MRGSLRPSPEIAATAGTTAAPALSTEQGVLRYGDARIGAVLRRLVLFSTLVLVAGGCGGSSPSSAPPAGGPAPTTTAPPVSPGATTTSEPPGLPTTPFKAKLVTDGPSPIVGKPWHFTVKASNRDGTPVAGTVKAEVLLSGKLIDTIGWFGFSGTLKHAVRWTSDKKGQPLVFRAEIDANGGAKYLDYPIRVK